MNKANNNNDDLSGTNKNNRSKEGHKYSPCMLTLNSYDFSGLVKIPPFRISNHIQIQMIVVKNGDETPTFR